MDLMPVARPVLGAEEAEAAAAAIASGWVAQGPRVAEFERALSKRVGADHGIAVSSCTAGLHLALVALEVGPGDEVVVPSLSFIATANAVRYVGAEPIFADVDPATQNLTAQTIAEVISPATTAVILVHQAGVPADIDAVRELCEPRGIAVVEDAACAIGSTYRDRPIGGHSDLVAFSFHPRKVITTGEGGMITTRRAAWAQRLRRLREHGMSMSAAERHSAGSAAIEEYVETGFNYRMTDIQAAIGLVQLGRLDGLVDRRREVAATYRSRLATIPGLQVVADPPHGTSNFQSFWIVLPDDFPVARNDLMGRMSEKGISVRRGIMAAHLEPAYRAHAHVPLPITERLTSQSLILPLFDGMTEQQVETVAGVIQDAAQVTV